MTGIIIHHYTTERELGRGGMATVFLAHDNKFDTHVAIKVLNKEFVHNDNIRKRFLAEARNMFKMSHPNIVKVTDLIDDNNLVAFVMEYVEGETLKEYLEKKGKLGDEEIRAIFTQMLDGVGYVHKQNLVHRDIKPSNFMIDREGNVKLMDFGIAKNTDANAAEYTQTGTGMQMGTPMYMSPEQITETKSVTLQSDIYSLGVVLWQMAAGRKPYDVKTLSSFQLQLKIVNDPLENTGTKWDAIIQKATAKEIKQRYSTATAFKEGMVVDSFKNSIEDEVTVIENKAKRHTPPAQNTDGQEGTSPLSGELAIEWADIPTGTFTMGSPKSEADRDDDEMQHKVTLDAFKMSKYEVTFAQYDAFCDATGRSKPADEGWGRGKRPVVNVSWEDAKAFAEWAGGQLPKEAQWEYACRAGRQTPFNAGTCLSTKAANYNGNYPYDGCISGTYKEKTVPVGSYAANAWGLYDMHGNVWEWCADWYGDYPRSPQSNPQGPSAGSRRVMRGGSWNFEAKGCRSAFRNRRTPGSRSDGIGFRLVSPR